MQLERGYMDLSEFKDGQLPEGYETENIGVMGDDATWRDRLALKFKPTDVVRVKNPDNEDFSWQFMPEDNELSVMNGDRTGYITYRKKPEFYTIKAGQEMPLVGANAYLMVEYLAKKMIIKWSEQDEKRKSNIMIQGTTKEEYINKIVVGVENLLSMAQKLDAPVVEDTLEADLGIEREIPKRHRPARA